MCFRAASIKSHWPNPAFELELWCLVRGISLSIAIVRVNAGILYKELLSGPSSLIFVQICDACKHLLCRILAIVLIGIYVLV